MSPSAPLVPRSRACAVAVALALAAGLPLASALAADLPGTPQPSRGTPGGIAGRDDPFGTEGDASRAEPSEAERRAAERHEVVQRIRIEGARQTLSAVVRNQLAISEGDRLTAEALALSRVRLLQLGTFSRVDLRTEPGSRPGRVVLRIDLEERSPILVTDLTVGQTAVSHLYGALGLADPSVLGLGVGLSLAGAGDGQGRRALLLTAYEPSVVVRGTPFVLGVQLVWQQGLESGCATPSCGNAFSSIPWLRYERRGGEISAGFRPGSFSRLLVGYRLELLDAASDPGVVPAARPEIREGRSVLSALDLGFDLDSRDDPFLPRHGARLQARLTLGTAALRSDYEYTRYLLQVEQWFPQGGGRAVRVDLALGLVQGTAPFYERFYAADWSYFSVGVAAPRALDLNFSPDSRYDVLLAVIGGEYNFRLWDRRGSFLARGFLALGARLVYSAARPDAGRSALSATPVSLDAALRIDTRLGIVSLGLGYAVDQILKAVPLHVPGIQHR